MGNAANRILLQQSGTTSAHQKLTCNAHFLSHIQSCLVLSKVTLSLSISLISFWDHVPNCLDRNQYFKITNQILMLCSIHLVSTGLQFVKWENGKTRVLPVVVVVSIEWWPVSKSAWKPQVSYCTWSFRTNRCAGEDDHFKFVVCPYYPATSRRPLRSLDWQLLFVLRVRTTMAQSRSFATIGPSLWNDLPSSLRLTLLSRSLSASLSLLKTYFYSQGLRTGRATKWSLPWAALYKFRNAIRSLRAWSVDKNSDYLSFTQT